MLVLSSRRSLETQSFELLKNLRAAIRVRMPMTAKPRSESCSHLFFLCDFSIIQFYFYSNFCVYFRASSFSPIAIAVSDPTSCCNVNAQASLVWTANEFE
jgi:hypothetical protein